MVAKEHVLAGAALGGASSIPLSRRFLDGKFAGITRIGEFGKPSSLVGWIGGGGALALGLAGAAGKGPLKNAESKEAAIVAGAATLGTALVAAIIEKFGGVGGEAPQAAGGQSTVLPGARGPAKQFL